MFAKPTINQAIEADRSTFCGKFASVGRPRLIGERSRLSLVIASQKIWVFAPKSAVCPVGRWSRLHALYQAQGFPLDTECDRWDRSSGMRATDALDEEIKRMRAQIMRLEHRQRKRD